jgi:AcrR family transcriptional regulator
MSTTKRPRAQRKSPEERTADIVAAARHVALTEGLSALTQRSIAAQAGIAPALVTHYYPSMEKLISQTFRDIVSEEITEVMELGLSQPTRTQALAAIIETVLDGTREDVTIVWVDAWSLGRRMPLLAASIREQMDAWHIALTQLIVEGITQGEFEEPDIGVDSIARQLFGMVDGLNAHALVNYTEDGQRLHLISRALEMELGLKAGALSPYLF